MDRFISHHNPIIKYERMFFGFISFWDLKSVMDRFVSHHNPLKYESMSFESIFTFWDLKKCHGSLY